MLVSVLRAENTEYVVIPAWASNGGEEEPSGGQPVPQGYYIL
ncbi:hypothetical protein CEB3_c43900 [Peptococcaceae bacterium CEB3]|nr:hypothetical protein CEB3_c43900 [Peptococcaceae bacterium CEB3]